MQWVVTRQVIYTVIFASGVKKQNKKNPRIYKLYFNIGGWKLHLEKASIFLWFAAACAVYF